MTIKITPKVCDQVRKRFNEVMTQAAEELGLKFEGIGRMTYDREGNYVRFRTEIIRKDYSPAKSEMAFAALMGAKFPPEGTEFRIGGVTYKYKKFNPRGRKNKHVITRVDNGKDYKCTDAHLRVAGVIT